MQKETPKQYRDRRFAEAEAMWRQEREERIARFVLATRELLVGEAMSAGYVCEIVVQCAEHFSKGGNRAQ